MSSVLRRALCALVGHVISLDSVDAWLRGQPVYCPRCGIERDYGPRPRNVIVIPDYEDHDPNPDHHNTCRDAWCLGCEPDPRDVELTDEELAMFAPPPDGDKYQ